MVLGLSKGVCSREGEGYIGRIVGIGRLTLGHSADESMSKQEHGQSENGVCGVLADVEAWEGQDVGVKSWSWREVGGS